MKRVLRAIDDLLTDGRGDWRFWWAQLVVQGDRSNALWACVDFFFAARYGTEFWRRTESIRRIRRWKRGRP